MEAVKRLPAWSQCAGKEPFNSALLANEVIRRSTSSKKRRGKKLSRPLKSYLCRHCGFFHIGGFGGK